MENSTIAALSSAFGAAAIAVIRVSGKDAFSIVSRCLRPSNLFKEIPARQIGLYKIVSSSDESVIDQAMVTKLAAPHSFTGEDMVEVYCHGGEMVVERVLSLFTKEGAVPAERGEFTKRAFLNGKFDLLHAEAILGLIESKTGADYEASLEAYMGGGARLLVEWRNTVRDLLRDLEAGIEFPEEEGVTGNAISVASQIGEIRKKIEVELENYKKSHIVEKGIIIPIVGVANAGKSSLFNLLAGFDRSIVHHVAGTTRDSVGEEMQIGAHRVTILDTAGLRETSDYVEKLGIKKTLEYIDRATHVLWVTPGNESLMTSEKNLLENCGKGKIAAIISKSDLGMLDEKIEACKNNKIPYICICLLDRGARKSIVEFVEKTVGDKVKGSAASQLVRTHRHEAIAERIVGRLRSAENDSNAGDEILAHHIKNVLSDFGEMIGETTTEDVLNSIFARFCIGK